MKKKIFVAMSIAAALSGCSGSLTSDNEPIATTDKIPAGIYKVGEDIPAGEYVFYANDGELGCVTITDSISSEAEELVYTNFYKNEFITVSENTYLNVSDAYFCPVTEGTIIPISYDSEASYRVGLDIPAGEYELVSIANGEFAFDQAYVTVRSDSSNLTGTIDLIESFDDNFYVEVFDGQYLELSQCTLLEEGE